MNTEKIQINMPHGSTDLTIRDGKAQELLPILKPNKIDLKGTINSVVEFLSRRFDQEDQINPKRCHVLIDRNEISILLVFHENNSYLIGTVYGRMELHQRFLEFGINSDKVWNPNKLGQFFKMNRSFFCDRESNMKLVTELKNFEAKIISTVEKQNNESGSFKDNYSGIVTSNLPENFSLNIPIFKGTAAEIIEVEFYASVNGREINLQLFSPGANQTIEILRDTIIDDQITKIREIIPSIVIIEK